MAAVTPAEAQAYFKRWEMVRELEFIELRRTSVDAKLHQLVALGANRSLNPRSLRRVPRKGECLIDAIGVSCRVTRFILRA